jgi:hypothetical protein
MPWIEVYEGGINVDINERPAADAQRTVGVAPMQCVRQRP